MSANCFHCGQQYPAGDCSRCAQCGRLPDVDMARSFGIYRRELSTVIRQYKYRADQSLAPGLCRLLRNTFERYWKSEQWDVVATVPTHSSRLRERGFDHVQLLARLFAKETGVPAVSALIKRVPTKTQAGLSEVQRRRNVRRTFQSARTFPGMRVLLLDDILTTGATVNECARMLKRAGASHVGVLTVARAE
ncbi:MAG TPA: ComF family protein [Acidobacteriota bacterium]